MTLARASFETAGVGIKGAAWIALSWLVAASAQAEPVLPFEVHAFVSQGFILTSKNNYLARSKRGSFEFNEVGLNVSKNLSDDVRLGMQLFARDLGPIGNYQPQFDWFQIDYRFRDWLGIRVGRTKIPFGLYNEINDIDVARVPILLPQSVYPTDHRDYLFAQTGVELYGNIPLGPAGLLEYRAYGGTIFLEPGPAPNPNVTVTHVDVPYVAGGRAMWLTPLDGLSLGASFQLLRIDSGYQFTPDFLALAKMVKAVPADFDGLIPIEFPLAFWVASIEYNVHDLLLAAEYSRWNGRIESGVPDVQPDIPAHNERYYAMASYRLLPWFAPCVYYSGYYVNRDDRHGKDAYQHDFAATLRFDLTTFWLLKLEGHLMRGTRALEGSPNDDQPLDKLTRDWVAFLIKTTAYF
ncbi:MAG TPA: hypothetical protein VJR89_23210 [Polyangiales bacterium]|nr:hypothetical protein [Polyangiales bacterium]